MKTRIILDTRHHNKSGLFPLKISISTHGKTALVPLDVNVASNHWNATTCRVVKHPQAPQINQHFYNVLNEVDGFLLGGNWRGLSPTKIKQLVWEFLHPTENTAPTLLEVWNKFASTKKGTTKQNYISTLKRIKDFDRNADKLLLTDITREWLSHFDNYLASLSLKVNTRSLYLHKINAVFNYALDEELTNHYPFRKFKIKNAETPKRSLSVEQLRSLFAFDAQGQIKEAIDMFKLSFFLMGINFVDLCNLRVMHDDRIEYYRSKTNKLYSVKVEQEAWEIINKYKGDGYLINAINRYPDYRSYTHHVNYWLRRIGNVNRVGEGGRKVFTPLFPYLTTYWARHTWATIAVNDLDAPFDVVSKALGHSTTSGAQVTSVYVDFDMRKVDALNRAVIDWVLYGKKN